MNSSEIKRKVLQYCVSKLRKAGEGTQPKPVDITMGVREEIVLRLSDFYLVGLSQWDYRDIENMLKDFTSIHRKIQNFYKGCVERIVELVTKTSRIGWVEEHETQEWDEEYVGAEGESEWTPMVRLQEQEKAFINEILTIQAQRQDLYQKAIGILERFNDLLVSERQSQLMFQGQRQSLVEEVINLVAALLFLHEFVLRRTGDLTHAVYNFASCISQGSLELTRWGFEIKLLELIRQVYSSVGLWFDFGNIRGELLQILRETERVYQKWYRKYRVQEEEEEEFESAHYDAINLILNSFVWVDPTGTRYTADQLPPLVKRKLYEVFGNSNQMLMEVEIPSNIEGAQWVDLVKQSIADVLKAEGEEGKSFLEDFVETLAHSLAYTKWDMIGIHLYAQKDKIGAGFQTGAPHTIEGKKAFMLWLKEYLKAKLMNLFEGDYLPNSVSQEISELISTSQQQGAHLKIGRRELKRIIEKSLVKLITNFLTEMYQDKVGKPQEEPASVLEESIVKGVKSAVDDKLVSKFTQTLVNKIIQKVGEWSTQPSPSEGRGVKLQLVLDISTDGFLSLGLTDIDIGSCLGKTQYHHNKIVYFAEEPFSFICWIYSDNDLLGRAIMRVNTTNGMYQLRPQHFFAQMNLYLLLGLNPTSENEKILCSKIEDVINGWAEKVGLLDAIREYYGKKPSILRKFVMSILRLAIRNYSGTFMK